MTKTDFVKAFSGFAKETEEKTGISAIAILAQAAHESGWGKAAPGNMFFGVKDTDGVNGNEQLVMTSEYSDRIGLKPSQLGLADIVSCTPVIINGRKKFKYRGHGYFKKYETPEGSFTDHATFFFKNPRYKNALEFKGDPRKFLTAVAAAGYATDPDYTKLLLSLCDSIEALI